MIEECPRCHSRGRTYDYCLKTIEQYPKIYKCTRCGILFCSECLFSLNVCPECKGRAEVIQERTDRPTEAELREKAKREAKRRAEEEAKRRAETLREFENKTYSLGTRIGNRYYSDYED